MHELSVARELIDLAVEQAAIAGASNVVGIRLRLGALSGVIPPALRTAFEAAKIGTPAGRARLSIEEVPPRIDCHTCGVTRELPGVQSRRCPVCGVGAELLTAGDELELVSVEVT